jgi:threonine synthase
MSRAIGYECIRCATKYPLDMEIDSRGCPACVNQFPANLRVVYGATIGEIAPTSLPSLWRYASRLPCLDKDAISLGEGLTPLLPADRLGLRIGVPNLLIKDEGANPTWSHKDRFSTVAVSAARAQGATVVATSSSGNAGASLAAYAARAGLACIVATFGDTSNPMIQQMRKYGATVLPFASKADRWGFLAEGVRRRGWFATSPFRTPVIGSHPLGIEGYKTLAYEIVDQMRGNVPDWCAMPVCYGDALAGAWQGFKDLRERKVIARMPRLLAAEAHGSLVAAMAAATDDVPEVTAHFSPLAVSVGATRSTFQALQALRESSGIAIPINNDGLVGFQETLASDEGILAELSAIMPLAAIAKASRHGVIGPKESVVAVVTASGLKDLDRSANEAPALATLSSLDQAWDSFDAISLAPPPIHDVPSGRRRS